MKRKLHTKWQANVGKGVMFQPKLKAKVKAMRDHSRKVRNGAK
jgi:hypothetical protein